MLMWQIFEHFNHRCFVNFCNWKVTFFGSICSYWWQFSHIPYWVQNSFTTFINIIFTWSPFIIEHIYFGCLKFPNDTYKIDHCAPTTFSPISSRSSPSGSTKVWILNDTNEPLPVEHFFPHFLSGLLRTHSKLAKECGKKS